MAFRLALSKDNKNQRDRQYLLFIISFSGALFVFILLLLIVIIVLTLPKNAVNTQAPVRDNKYVEAVTSCGKVEGLLHDGAVAFRGIPYARSPVGELRFKYAQPMNNLDYCWNGTYLAHNASETCLQVNILN